METIFHLIEKIAIFLLIFIGIGFWFINKILKKRRINQSMNYKLMMIRVPQDISGDKNENAKKVGEMIANCDQMISNLNKFKYPIVFEVASPIDSRETVFYVATHRKHIEMIQKMITAYFPFGEVSECKDYTVFGLNNHYGGAIGKLNTNFALPIKTYQNFESDSFSSILNAFSKIGQNEGMAMQIILSSTSSEKKEIKKILEKLKDGKKEKDLFSKKMFDFSGISESLNPFSKSDDKDKKEAEAKVIDEVLIKSVESKISQPLFSVNVRVVVSSPDKQRIDSLLQEIQNGFMQLSSPVLNLIELKKQKRGALQDLMFQYVYRLFDNKHRMILNSSEINSFWHLPHFLLEVPNVKWLKSRTAPVPANLPEEGVILGKNSYRGDERLVKFKLKDRRLHTYVIGQTGTGKTTLLKNMIAQDIKDGQGVCFIDPHGDIANEILDFIPQERIKDVIYFNPADPKYTMSFNILESSPEKQMDQTFIIDEVLEIMDKLYDLKTTGGPIFEQYMRNALALLMSDPEEQFTLMDVPSVLINDKFRGKLLARTTNFIVKDFWEKEAEKAGGDLSLNNMAPYINSKLTPFLTNNVMRPIIGQKKSSLNFDDILNTEKIFIVNLSKGILGETNAYLIGMILVGKLSIAAFARAAIPENERKDFYLYIDEFQNVTTKTIPTILSEARKFRLALIIAHQYVTQIKEEIRDAVFGNVGTKISFRISPDDGERMKKFFTPVFNDVDLISISNYNAYVSLLIDGEPSRPFNIATIRPEVPVISYKQDVIESSNAIYARVRKEVDEEIMERFLNNNKESEPEAKSKPSADNEEKAIADNEEKDDNDFDEEFLNEILASMREDDKKDKDSEKQ